MENITAYVEQETRGFDELAPTDVDLLALCALLYAEFERFPHFLEPNASTRIGDLLDYGTALEYVEHDCNPQGMEPLIAALVASPRFRDVRIERFRCIVSEKPQAIQFGAACYRISSDLVAVTLRGTDSKLVGWQEDLELVWREAGPGQIEALRYLREAADAYPQARLIVCGHSKGGCEAEYAAVFAESGLATRIERAVSFDGPSLFKEGSKLTPSLKAYDDALRERYQQLAVPLERYIFRSLIGLALEERGPSMFAYVDSVDMRRPHNVCSARIAQGAFASWTPRAQDLAPALDPSRALAKLSLAERRFASDFIIGACKRAGIGINLSDEGLKQIQRALLTHYRAQDLADRRIARRVIRVLTGAPLLL